MQTFQIKEDNDICQRGNNQLQTTSNNMGIKILSMLFLLRLGIQTMIKRLNFVFRAQNLYSKRTEAD